MKLSAFPTVLLLDLDGTLHRGCSWLNQRGYSNVELFAELVRREFPGITPASRGALAMLRIRSLDRRLQRAMAAGRLTMAERDRRLVETYVAFVLPSFTPSSFIRAASYMPNFIWPAARTALGRAPDWVKAGHIISKGFQAVVDAYARALTCCSARPFSGAGNQIIWTDLKTPILDPANSVLTADDKTTAARRFLTTLSQPARCIVIGDTCEDIGMFRAAREVLGPGHVLAVAVRPKDAEIIAAADVTVESWEKLSREVFGREHEQF